MNKKDGGDSLSPTHAVRYFLDLCYDNWAITALNEKGLFQIYKIYNYKR